MNFKTNSLMICAIYTFEDDHVSNPTREHYIFIMSMGYILSHHETVPEMNMVSFELWFLTAGINFIPLVVRPQ